LFVPLVVALWAVNAWLGLAALTAGIGCYLYSLWRRERLMKERDARRSRR
jgi:hypothetical protein